MKGLLLSALIVLALGQAIPPSSNPPSTSYFAPSVVRTLNFGEKVSSTIYNQTGYQDHYQIFIPSWVKSIRYTLNNTDQTVFTYLEMQISAPNRDNYDTSLGYPCSESSVPAACDDYDWYLYSYTGYSEYRELRAGDDFFPGTWQWITVFSYYEVGLTYELLVEAVSTCDQNDVVSVDYSDAECIPSQNIHSVPYSGYSFSGISSLEDPQYFKVSVPKNTIRIYALMTSSESYLDFLYAGAFVPASFYHAWDYASSGTYNNDGTYSFYLEIPQPQYDLPFYFSVIPYYSDNFGFTIQFFWDDCGNDFAGYGQINVDYYVPSVSFSIPDCSDPVVATVEANNYSPITFNLPAYDSAVDKWYAAAYATLKVPVNTAGYRNFTCTASVDNIFVVFSKEKTADCTGEYSWYKYCDGPTTTYYQNLLLLSEDLYTGGDWSIGACNSNSQPVTVTLYSSGQIYAEPSPSPSSTPSPTPSGSSSPSSIPSASASPDSDSPSDGPQPPAGLYVLFLVIGFLLGVIVGLILGIYIFNKVSARKQASMSYVPLQPYAMPWNAMPVQMPMYNPEN